MGGENGGKYIGKTFRANGNIAMRVLYANQKYMSYALEVSDKIFEGGTNAAVDASLRELNANLSEDETARLAAFEGNKRTLKDATWEDTAKDRKTHENKTVKKGSQFSQLAVGAKSLLSDKLGVVGDVMGETPTAGMYSVSPLSSLPAGSWWRMCAGASKT